jgi:hypothetical protein
LYDSSKKSSIDRPLNRSVISATEDSAFGVDSCALVGFISVAEMITVTVEGCGVCTTGCSPPQPAIERNANEMASIENVILMIFLMIVRPSLLFPSPQ